MAISRRSFETLAPDWHGFSLEASRRRLSQFAQIFIARDQLKGGLGSSLCYKGGERLAADAPLANRVRSERKQP
jgi:hypothetical protein